MKKFFTLVAATALAVLSLIPSESYGSHAVGADVTYQYVGNNQYLITVRFYRDCDGITASTSVSVGYTSSCFTGGNITLNLLPGSGTQIPPTNCLPAVTTSCNGGNGYGVEEYIYQGLVTLPGPCADWTFDFDMCCRNAQISTIPNADSYDLYVETTLDNINFPVNSSPVFANIPVTQFCVGNQFYYNQGATDADGDSLVFSLGNALGFGGTALIYGGGYSATQPVASAGPITIDPVTGTISFTPTMVQVGVIVVICEEYRNGIKIGEVQRDIQINIVSGCIGTTPVFSDPVDPQGNPAPYYSANCGDDSFYIVLADPVQCGSIVPTDIRILTPQGLLNPVLSTTPINCVNGLTDSILVTFFYPLTIGTTYAFTKEGFDNNTFLSECGVEMAEFDSIPFNVVDPGIFNTETIDVNCTFDEVTVTFDYEISCSTLTSSGSEFYMVDANNVTYPVTAIGNCPGGNSYSSTVTFNFGNAISPATPLYLIVQQGTDANTFTNRCNTFINAGDTLAVLNVLNNLAIDLGTDVQLCAGDPLPVLDAGLSGLTYSWTLDGNPLPDQTQTITASQSGVYEVTVTATPTCTGTDAIQVTIDPAPVVSLGNDIILCASDPLPLLDAGNPGAVSYQWSLDGNPIPNGDQQTYQPTTGGTYSVVVNTGISCTGSDEIIITIQQQLVVSLPTDQSLCSNDPLPVLDAGIPNGTYVWTLDGNPVGGNSQTLQTTASGTYAVQVTSVSGCTGTDEFILTVVQAPQVSLNPNYTVCAGTSYPVLDAGAGFTSYLWSDGSTSQTFTPSSPGTYTVTVTNSGGSISCSATSSTTIVAGNPVPVDLGADITICDGAGSQVIDAGVSGAAAYEWSLNGNVISGQTGQTITPANAGTYSVLVTDVDGCTGTDNVEFTVNANPVVTLGEDLAICPGEDFPVLNGTTSNASTYDWSLNGNTVGNGASYDPGDYGVYTLTVTDLNGCVGTDELVINEAPCQVEIPNVFTPGNGDGLNDVFFIKNLDTNPNSTLVIFNRWGNEVYSNSNYQNNWNGDNLPDGTYFYSLRLQSGKDYNGTLKLIRKE